MIVISASKTVQCRLSWFRQNHFSDDIYIYIYIYIMYNYYIYYVIKYCFYQKKIKFIPSSHCVGMYIILSSLYSYSTRTCNYTCL